MAVAETLTVYLVGVDEHTEQGRQRLIAALSSETTVPSPVRAQLVAALARPSQAVGSVAVCCAGEHAQTQAALVSQLCNKLRIEAIVSVHRPARLTATFQGQQWWRDYAVNTDDVYEFEVGDLVVAMSEERREELLRQLRGPANDFDALAEAAWADGRLPEHHGPFEVYVDNDDLEALLNALGDARHGAEHSARVVMDSGRRVTFGQVVTAGLELTRGQGPVARLNHPDGSTTRVLGAAEVSVLNAHAADTIQWYEPGPTAPSQGGVPPGPRI